MEKESDELTMFNSKSLARTFENHAKEHYPSYTLGVYPTGDDSAVAIALVANKYSPHNFWYFPPFPFPQSSSLHNPIFH